MPEVYVGLGSNVEPESNLAVALQALRLTYGLDVCSSVYRSPAYGFTGDDFLNMVVKFRSVQPLAVIEDHLSSIEHAGGRQRRNSRFCARTLDLDLLIYGACVSPVLRLPRDDVSRYPFVLRPMAEIAPDLVHPVNGVTMRDAWTTMLKDTPDIRRVGSATGLARCLPADAATAVHSQNLTGDVGRVADEK
jgi:2-amino-4-hydroxy-6-hydroxymethyldihydropteridine diphosphokinase